MAQVCRAAIGHATAFHTFGQQLNRALRHVRRMQHASQTRMPLAVYNTFKLHAIRARCAGEDLGCAAHMTQRHVAPLLQKWTHSSAVALHQLQVMSERQRDAGQLQVQLARLSALHRLLLSCADATA
jgi:hypothetical protein